MDDLLDDFVAEARDMLEALSGEIVAWESDPSDRERLDAIFRFAHTVKGNCGFFDFPHLEKLSHAVEDALADCRAGRRQADGELVTAVLALIDRIAESVDSIGSGKELEKAGDEKLIAALAAHSEGDPQGGEKHAIAEPDTRTGSAGDGGLEGEGAVPASRAGVQRTIRLPVELLDRVMSGISDMAVVRNDLARRLAVTDGAKELQAPFSRLSAVLADLSDTITSIRMQRIETLFSGFPRLARDLSHELGKQVNVVLECGDVEIDRELIEVVRDPMVHIIRNAVDHGIEAPEKREAAGKPATGIIRVTARQTGSEIHISIADDGRGIDTKTLVEKAVASKRITAEEAEKLSARERNQLVCETGVSTAAEVTAVSGRGVGMDVVRSNIGKIGGTLDIDSTPGAGTQIVIKIPLTLSIVPSLTLSVGGQTFVLPRSYVEEIVHPVSKGITINFTGGRKFITLRGTNIPCVGLDEVLGIDAHAEGEKALYILIKLVGGDMFGLAVDEIIDHEDLVVSPVAPVLMKCGLYVGSTQLDDGRPVPMLDVAGVASAAGMVGEVKNLKVRDDTRLADVDQDTSRPALLFVGFDGQERAIEMDAVRRIEKLPVSAIRHGQDGNSHIAIDGRIVPLVGLAGELPHQMVTLFSVGEGDNEIAYAYARMIDLVSFEPADVRTGPSASGPRITLVNSCPVELIDEASILAGEHCQVVAQGGSR